MCSVELMIRIPRVNYTEKFEFPNLEDYPNKMVDKVVRQPFQDKEGMCEGCGEVAINNAEEELCAECAAIKAESHRD